MLSSGGGRSFLAPGVASYGCRSSRRCRVGLQPVGGFVGLLAAHDPEVLIQERPVQLLDEAVGLGPPDPGRPVRDTLGLEEQLVRMAVFATAEFPPVVVQHRGDRGLVHIEGGQHVVVHQMHRGDR